MTTIASLTEKILAFRDERDWLQFHNPKDMPASIAIEAAELQELLH
jgi:NTP pyrophosphatase (non-canonical NTP hydrolase)